MFNTLYTNNIIYLVRHGETDWNRFPKKFQGRKNLPLNTIGIYQAYCLAKYFKKINIAYIFTSPLKRAYKTAEIINRFHSLSIFQCEELIEMNFGDWEGKTTEEIKQNYPHIWQLWQTHPEKVKIPKAETLEELIGRCYLALEKIKKYSGGPKLVITHGAFLRAMIIGLSDKPKSSFNKITQDNGAINIIHFKNFPKLLLINYTGHLNNRSI